MRGYHKSKNKYEAERFVYRADELWEVLQELLARIEELEERCPGQTTK